VDDLIDDGEIALLMNLLVESPRSQLAPARLRAQVMRPSTIWRLVETGHVGEDSLGLVIEGMKNDAVSPLLDILIETESRSVRRRIFDYLIRIGPEAGRGAVHRLNDPRWYVARNVLALLNRVRVIPEAFDPLEYLGHEDARVRREALSLALGHRPVKERALALGLIDEDERLVRMSLAAIQDELPESLLPTLLDHIVHSAEHPPDLRALGVRALRHSRSRRVPETLMEMVVARLTIFGRPKLAAPEPDVLAAILVLHDHWHDYPKVADVLKAARRSRDPQVRAAAEGSEVRR
jgi:hypothetical protein